jgi:hypothetical protein
VKKTLIVLMALALAVSASAQIRTGNIYGKVTDNENNPLPGVSMTLTSPNLAPLTTLTNDQGIFRFPSLSPGNRYTLKAELQGFKGATKTEIVVAIGVNAEINLQLEQGRLDEQVTVVAKTPVVDSKKTSVATNFDHEALQSLPSARDPWVILQMSPGILLDRENVGGNESGQQSSFMGKGDAGNNFYVGANNIWAVDGIDITDPAALGGSALYYDFDMFEELNITTGGADVSIQTGGIALNMVTRRGGNKTSLAGRFYLTDNFFQADNLTDDLIKQGVAAINKIQQIKDFGFNAGGPVLKDKVWWWGAYGVQDIFTYTMYNTQNKALLNNYNFKLNAQIFTNNRFEAMVTSGAKELYGRNAAVNKPEGDHQTGKYHWGSPIVKFQDEQSLGSNLFFSLKYSFNDAGFGWVPMVDESLSYPVVFDQTSKAYSGALYSTRSWPWYRVSRPRNNYQAGASYFNDGLLGLSHEFKAGFEYSNKEQEDLGNYHHFDININYPGPTLDLNGDGTREVPTGWRRFSFFRGGNNISNAYQIAGYLQDTLTKGRFTVVLGVRYDFQQGYSKPYDITSVRKDISPWQKAVDTTAMDKMSALLPVISVKKITPEYNWKTWSPRLGLTWDIFGDGKTIAKISAAQYGDIMGVGQGVSTPLGTGGSMNFWWNDANADNKVSLGELYWMYAASNAKKYQVYNVFDGAGNFVGDWTDGRSAGMYSGFDPAHPTELNYESATAIYDPSARRSSRTSELMLTLEKELLPDLSAAINFSLRKYDHFEWWQGYYPSTGVKINSTSWYVPGGKVPATVGGISTGDAAGKTWYVITPDYVPYDYNYVTSGDNYNTYMGVDFVVNKRLSNKWYMNASFTWQDQKQYVGSTYLDITNKWMTDGTAYAPAYGGASGKTNINMYSRWMAKVSALYQLPWDVDLSATFNAREGWKIPHSFWIEDANLPGLGTGNTIYTQTIDKDALPTFYNISLRVEKMIRLGDTGRLYFMADVFNLLNSAIVNRAYAAYFGEYYVDTNTFVSNPTNRKLNEILNPRVIRFGTRFQF